MNIKKCVTHHEACECRQKAMDAQVARLEGENVEMAAALREFGHVLPNDPNEEWHSNDCEGDCGTRATWYSARCRKARAALSGEGKVWEQVEKVLNVWTAVQRAEKSDSANLLAGRHVPLSKPGALQMLSASLSDLAAMKGEWEQVARVRCTYCGKDEVTPKQLGVTTDKGIEQHEPDCPYLRATKMGWQDE